MRRFALKALFALLMLNRDDDDDPPRWDRIILFASTVVTIGLIAVYAYGKATGRW
jgi:hypothetical protein